MSSSSFLRLSSPLLLSLISPHLLLLLALLIPTATLADPDKDVPYHPSSPTASDSPFCSEYGHLSLCQLRQSLSQSAQLLEAAIGEIDFLAGGAADMGMPKDWATPVGKRAKVSLADPMLAQLAALPSTRSGPGGGPNSWLGGIRQQQQGRQSGTGRPSSGSYRLVRLQRMPGPGLLRQLFRMS